jgi:hypothetical protein
MLKVLSPFSLQMELQKLYRKTTRGYCSGLIKRITAMTPLIDWFFLLAYTRHKLEVYENIRDNGGFMGFELYTP